MRYASDACPGARGLEPPSRRGGCLASRRRLPSCRLASPVGWVGLGSRHRPPRGTGVESLGRLRPAGRSRVAIQSVPAGAGEDPAARGTRRRRRCPAVKGKGEFKRRRRCPAAHPPIASPGLARSPPWRSRCSSSTTPPRRVGPLGACVRSVCLFLQACLNVL